MILITGASRGIGKYLLKKFIDKSEWVSGTYLFTEPEKEIKSFLKQVNLLDFAKVEQWIESSCNIDTNYILLNCAGINYNVMAHKADLSDWSRVVATNLICSFNAIAKILPIMRKNNYGRIINFGSVVAKMGIPGTSAYAASKSGLWGMTKAIAAENASKGITINTINLGYFDIGMISEVPADIQEKMKQKIPCGRFGNPEQIWNTVNYIIENDYLNGAEIDLNGGVW